MLTLASGDAGRIDKTHPQVRYLFSSSGSREPLSHSNRELASYSSLGGDSDSSQKGPAQEAPRRRRRRLPLAYKPTPTTVSSVIVPKTVM